MSPYLSEPSVLPSEKNHPAISGLPQFPTDVAIAPLVQISVARLRVDVSESDRLFEACKSLGFFYLDLRGDDEGEQVVNEANQLFTIEEELFKMSGEELSKYDFSKQGSYYGYKGFGKAIIDSEGHVDRNEFYNAGKDDFLGISKDPFVHPPLLNDNALLLQSYMRHSHSLLTVILDHLTTHLKLPQSTLANLHRQTAISGDHLRFIKAPPQPQDDLQIAMGAHTDFGSLTMIMNRLGGLQVLPPKSSEWCYIRPLHGHCIVNLGDAMVRLSNGLLRSNIHRVLAPPGEQSKFTRHSLVYFARPEDDVPLKRLEGSSIIPNLAEGVVEKDVCAKEWISERTMSRRVGVRKGPQKFKITGE